jgi:hypothetical protein
MEIVGSLKISVEVLFTPGNLVTIVSSKADPIFVQSQDAYSLCVFLYFCYVRMAYGRPPEPLHPSYGGL